MNIVDFINRMLAGDPNLNPKGPSKRKNKHKSAAHKRQNAAQRRKVRRKIRVASRKKNRT